MAVKFSVVRLILVENVVMTINSIRAMVMIAFLWSRRFYRDREWYQIFGLLFARISQRAHFNSRGLIKHPLDSVFKGTVSI